MLHLRTAFLAALAAVTASASAAQAPDWSRAARVDVALANFSFSPKTIRLRAGEPVVLHLANSASGGHNFAAGQFFSASTIRPQDRGAVNGGAVELRGHQSKDIALVPRAGHYPLRCTHTLHKMFGMTGEIVVE
jgi:uncharacterized cupredoxin-like copper-binding protein